MTVAIGNYVAEFEGAKVRISDANFEFALVSSNPRWTLDSGDYIEYDRAANNLIIRATTLDMRLNDITSNYFFGSDGSGNPQITFDTGGDYWYYVRSTNTFTYRIANITKLQIAAATITFGVDGSAPALVLASMDGTNEGGELRLNGAAANIDWIVDNYGGTIRFIEGGLVDLTLALAAAGMAQLTIGNGTNRASLYMKGNATDPGRFVIEGNGTEADWIFDAYGGKLRFMSVTGTEYNHFLPAGSAIVGYLRVGSLIAPANTAAGDMTVDGKFRCESDIDHNGANIGFFGVAPAARVAAYTPTNVVADRAYDANATTTDELADVLGTLIADLKSYGLLQ